MKPAVSISFAIAVAAFHLCAHGQTVPTLIVKSELQSFDKWLVLSEPQFLQLQSLHDGYVADWENRFGQKLKELNALRHEAMMGTRSRSDLHGGESIVATVALAAELADQLRPQLDGANAAFFAQLDGILTDEQAARLDRVRLGHDRRRTFKRSFTVVRESNIDPVDLVEQLMLSPDETAKIEVVITHFEPSFVSALRDVAFATDRGMKHEAVAAEWRRAMDMGAAGVQEGHDAFIAWQHKAAKESLHEYKRLVEIIRNGLKQFSEVLSPANAEALTKIARQKAYPETWPDPLLQDGDTLYRAAESLEGLNNDQRDALSDMLAHYHAEHDRLSIRMAEEVFRFGMAYQERVPETYEAQTVAAQDELRRLGQQRDDLTKAQWNKVKGILSPEQAAQLPAWPYQDKEPPRYWDPANWAKAFRNAKSFNPE